MWDIIIIIVSIIKHPKIEFKENKKYVLKNGKVSEYVNILTYLKLKVILQKDFLDEYMRLDM